MLQLLQLEAVQPEHELAVPAMGVDSPPLPLENEANREKTRLAVCWHCGHEASSSALFIERNSSNLQAHSGHRYS
jgi:hypothetical protein